MEENTVTLPLPKESFEMAFNVVKSEAKALRQQRQCGMGREAFFFSPKIRDCRPLPGLINKGPNETS